MPILLKTRVERTAKTPIKACHARVGGLCGFRSSVEQRTHREHENRTLRRRAGALRKWQTQKKDACRRLSAEGEAASGEQEKGLTLFCVWPSTSARSAGSFGG